MTECRDGEPRQSGATLQDARLKTDAYQQTYLMSNLNNVVAPLQETPSVSRHLKLLASKNNTDALVNRVTVPPEVITFFDGRPIDYGQLVPHIQIYKVYIKNRKRVSEVLFPFRAYTDFEQMKPQNFLRAPFRGTDAGIESVDLKLEGKGRNPVSMSIMQLTIKLVFNDVKTLFRPLGGSPWGVGNVQYSDLMRYPPGQLTDDADPRTLPASFRIRLSLGWNLRGKARANGLSGFSMAKGNPIFEDQGLLAGYDFVDAVLKSKISFIGDLWSHDMDFLENGSVKVTLKYMGALENSFKTGTADLLKTYSLDGNKTINKVKDELRKYELTAWRKALGQNKKLKNVLTIRKKAKEVQALINNMEDKLQSTEETIFVDAKEAVNKSWTTFADARKESAVLGTTSGKLNEAATDLKVHTMEKVLRNEVATAESKLDQLAFSQMGGAGSAEANAWMAELQKKRKELMQKIQTFESQLRAKYLFSYIIKLIEANKLAWIDTSTDEFQSFLHHRIQYAEAATKKQQEKEMSGMKQVSSTVASSDVETVETSFAQELGDPSAASAESVTKSDATLFLSEQYKQGDKLMFFRLGDLVSIMLDHANFGESLETLVPDFKILFGNFDYSPIGSDNLRRASLYDLPVSLKLFEKFIAMKIVGTGRQSYLFMDFVEDLIQFLMDKVITPSSPDGATSANPVNGAFKIGIVPIDLPKKLIKSSFDANGRHTDYEVDLDDIAGSPRNLSVTQISNTFLIHAYKTEPFEERIKNSYTGDRFKDRKEGIFHFLVGGPNRGLLKSITFQQMQNTKHAMGIFEKAQSGGIASRRGVIKPAMFGCELTLVGNPYFLIGQQFYVNTSLISANNFANEMMMNGGYYMVTSVESHFGVGKWETKVKGILQVADSVLKNAKKEGVVEVYNAGDHFVDNAKTVGAAAYSMWQSTGIPGAAKSAWDGLSGNNEAPKKGSG